MDKSSSVFVPIVHLLGVSKGSGVAAAVAGADGGEEKISNFDFHFINHDNL